MFYSFNRISLSNKHVRYFSISGIRFTPDESGSSSRSVAPFSQSTNEERSFLFTLIFREDRAIQQLNHTIEHNNNQIRIIYNNSGLGGNLTEHIAHLNNLIEEDLRVRAVHEQTADLLIALHEGTDPPTNDTNAWFFLRDSLVNEDDMSILNLRQYVQGVVQRTILPEYLHGFQVQMANHRENLLDSESRDNSQYSDEMDQTDTDNESNSSEYGSAVSNQDSSDSSSESNSDYHSAATNQDDLDSSSEPDSSASDQNHSDSSSESDSNDNPPSSGQIADSNNNQPESSSNLSKPSDSHDYTDKESKASSDKNLTEDALDISDTLHMFFDETPEENKSTIDFVLQKQQEEMPDIYESDGGE